MATRLIQVLALLYQLQPEEVHAIEDDLLNQRKQAWRTALSQEAQRLGCRSASPRDPSGKDLRELRAMSHEDATSIAKTYNQDVERQLQKLYNANVRGNRNYYISNMEVYLARRSVSKSQQIALNTVQQTRGYAVSRFHQENGLRGNLYVFVGPPPVCSICVGHFAAGVVDQRYVDRNPIPVHPGCPHEWQLQTTARLDCADIWLG